MFNTYIMTIRNFLAPLLLSLTCCVAYAQVPGSAMDVQHYAYALKLNDADNNIVGAATIDVKFLKDAKEAHFDLTKKNAEGKGMTVSSVKENGKALRFEQSEGEVTINSPAKAGSLHRYVIDYSGIPADGLIISSNKFGKRTFFGDNWPNRAHNWLPCIDDPADKASLEFEVTAPAHYQVIANGLKIKEQTLPNSLKLTQYKETAPLAPKIFVIGVAEFAIDNPGNPDGIPVYTYVFPENKELGFQHYAVAKEILPFYINKFGPYAYKKLANVQSKTRYGGLENASAIFYNESSVSNRSVEDLMAHEIAHQWFGDAAGEKSFANLWLSEGFATYMTNVYLESKYGPDTLKKREARDRNTVINFERRRMTPVVDTTTKGDFMVLLNANSYQKGGWVLHMLRRKLGEDAFWKGIRAYYAKYKDGNANTDDFRVAMEQAGGQNLKPFVEQWLLTPGHPALDISWVYNASTKNVSVTITQTQDHLFDFPLEVSVQGQKHSIPVKEKTTTVKFPATGLEGLAVDPDVNLLASFKETKTNVQN